MMVVSILYSGESTFLLSSSHFHEKLAAANRQKVTTVIFCLWQCCESTCAYM